MRKEFVKELQSNVDGTLKYLKGHCDKINEFEKELTYVDCSWTQAEELKRNVAFLKYNAGNVKFEGICEAVIVFERFKIKLERETWITTEVDRARNVKFYYSNLNERDLAKMIGEHIENPFMLRQIMKYAKMRNFDLGIRCMGVDYELEAVNTLYNAVIELIENPQSQDLYNRLFGNNSSLVNIFYVDDDYRRRNPIIEYNSEQVENAVRLLSNSCNIDDTAQVNIVREFEGQNGVLSVLESAAKSGGKNAALEEIGRMIGD